MKKKVFINNLPRKCSKMCNHPVHFSPTSNCISSVSPSYLPYMFLIYQVSHPYPVNFYSIISNKIRVLHAFKQNDLVCQFFQSLVIISLKLHLKSENRVKIVFKVYSYLLKDRQILMIKREKKFPPFLYSGRAYRCNHVRCKK